MTTRNHWNEDGPLTTRTANFFASKTVQRNYNFVVYFDEHADEDSKLLSNLGAFHATSVEIPDYSFKKEYIQYGSFTKSFPILDHNGFEFTMKLEEDEEGNVKGLIQDLIKKQIGTNGYYNSYKETVIKRLVVSIYTHDSINVYKVFFTNCYFLKSSTATYTYNSNEKIEYDITFNCDHYIIHANEGALNKKENVRKNNTINNVRDNLARQDQINLDAQNSN